MKNVKLVCCSLLISACIGFTGNSEARVTKEVAEVVLPFLMEAAEIPNDQDGDIPATKVSYKKEKVDAIIDMIYTDEGQKQMVGWAVKNERPKGLAVFGEPFDNEEDWKANSSNKKEEGEEELLLQKLFPCNTGTFTSFANHNSRLGKHILNSPTQTAKNLKELISIKTNSAPSNIDEILQWINTRRQTENIDIKISKIIFILDICDDYKQLVGILSGKTRLSQPETTQCEYTCRPVAATVANDEGDCVETLYRHLINIAIQDPTQKNRHIFHIERLPIPLRLYFTREKNEKNNFIELKRTEAGLTSIDAHNKWQKALRSVSEHGVYFNTSTGSIANIARTLYYIAFFDELKNQVMTVIPDKNNEQLIEDAMNKLAALKSGNPRFSVSVTNREKTDPLWVTEKITINDLYAKRNIVIGICEEFKQDFGHAEIINITQSD